jgi:tetratricopeptide (TPR) repeat protein
MGEKPKMDTMPDNDPKIVIGVGTRRKWRPSRRVQIVLVLALALVLVGVGATVVYLQRKHNHEQVVAKQKKLESRVSDIDSYGNLDKLKTDTNELIKGAGDGTYDVSSKQLAQAYALRGDTKLNERKYQDALDDYKKAVELDASRKVYVGYGEFIARYNLGERKELIPLLRSLQKPLKDSFESQNQQQFALYEQYAADLEAGKDLQGIQ